MKNFFIKSGKDMNSSFQQIVRIGIVCRTIIIFKIIIIVGYNWEQSFYLFFITSKIVGSQL